MPADPLTLVGAAFLLRRRGTRRTVAGLVAVDGQAAAAAVGGNAYFSEGRSQWRGHRALGRRRRHSAKLDTRQVELARGRDGPTVMGQTRVGLPGHQTLLQSKVVPLTSRPSASSGPATIHAWCQKYGIAPLFAYPEFGWKIVGRSATAAYDLDSSHHVAWTMTLDGISTAEVSWGYHEITDGPDLGQIIGDIAKLASMIPAIGPWVGMAIDTALAISEGKSISDIGNALKADWDAAMTTCQMGYAVITGNWGHAWDAATEQGKNLEGLYSAWGNQPAPDRFGNETIQLPAPLDLTNIPPPLTNPEAPGLASVSGPPPKKGKTGKGSARRARRGR